LVACVTSKKFIKFLKKFERIWFEFEKKSLNWKRFEKEKEK
jgi:hypothetical protein